MIKKFKIPTIIGMIVLVFGIVAGVFMINSRQVFKLGANVDALPKNVRFSNVTNTSFTVSWTTDIESEGFVKWGTNDLSLSKVSLGEGSGKSFVHSATVVGAEPNTKVYLKINSNGKDYDNDGISWQQNTEPNIVNSNQNLIASGNILKVDASTPAVAIVYLTVNGTLLSALSSQGGSYVIPVSTYIQSISDTTPIEISIQGGQDGISQAVIYPKFVKNIPTIILGKNYDFRTLQESSSGNLPESSLNIPESIEVSSRFEIIRSNDNSEPTTLSIDSVDEGEIITTTDPEFFGSGPVGSQIEIQIESELQTGTISTDTKGKWSWSPPNNLETGEHKLTVNWRDANGILRTITRTFIVSAAEGPAFESTPSATPQNTTTPVATATAVSTSSATPKTPTATMQPTPETGSLTPTMGLFLMGIGILLSSVFVYKKSNVY